MRLDYSTVDASVATIQRIGLASMKVAYGVQFNIMVGNDRHGAEADCCGHNCTTTNGCATQPAGGYNCDAAYTVTGGVKKSSLASLEVLQARAKLAIDGMALANQMFLQHDFDPYCEAFRIPSIVKEALRRILSLGGGQFNIFGGDPDLYPQLIPFIRFLQALGLNVNLTTTGQRFLVDEQYTEDFLADPPHVLALSLDDMTLKEFQILSQLKSSEIRAHWEVVRRNKDLVNHGQVMKALEGIHALTLLYERCEKDEQGRPAHFLPLLNMVLHSGNLGHVYEIVDAVQARFPGTIVNPYPNQTALARQPGTYTPRDLELFDEYTDHAIDLTLAGGLLVPRIHYWVFIKTLSNARRGNYEAWRDGVAGDRSWKCYKNGTRYGQIGKFASPDDIPVETVRLLKGAGGFPNCFWPVRGIVADPNEIRSAEHFADYNRRGIIELGNTNGGWCSSLMPRLVSDLPNLERGIDDESLIPNWLQNRADMIGF